MRLADDIQLLNGAFGGLIIGAMSTAMFYFTGKVSGISGIVEDVILSKPCAEEEDWCSWTHSYVSGLLASGVVLAKYYPGAFGSSPDAFHLHPEVIAAAGLLTGLGSRLGSGCTSGHGICGLPRRSPRSLTAVLTFMTTGAAAVYWSRTPFMKNLLEEVSGSLADHKGTFLEGVLFVVPTVATYILTANVYSEGGVIRRLMGVSTKEELTKSGRTKVTTRPVDWFKVITTHTVSFLSAFVFGIGLGISGMTNPDRVHRFLDFSGAEGFDPTLMGVMGGGVLLNLVTFHWMHHNELPVPLAKKVVSTKDVIKLGLVPQNMRIDWKLVLGTLLSNITSFLLKI